MNDFHNLNVTGKIQKKPRDKHTFIVPMEEYVDGNCFFKCIETKYRDKM